MHAVRLVRNNIQAGEELHYRLVRKYIQAVRPVRNYIQAGEKLYTGW